MAEDDPFAHISATRNAASEDDPFAHIGAPKATLGETALDVAKQIPSGLVAGTEAVATFPAQIAALLAPLANKYVPSWLGNDPEAQARQAELRALTSKMRGGGIADYLPQPETTAGKFVRTASEFVPAAVTGGRGSPLRAAGVGATTGAASEGAGQLTEGTAAEPYARIGAALATGNVARRMAEGAATREAIGNLRQGTEASANRAYDQFRNSGFAFDPAAGTTYSLPLKAALRSDGMTRTTAARTWEVLDDIERTPFTNPVQLQERYKELGSVMRAARDPEERRAAVIAQERLLQIAENPPPWLVTHGDPAAGVALLRDANANWAAARRAENLDRRINAAELRAGANYSGLNLENELRRRVGVLSDPQVRGGFSPAEQRAFDQYARGGAYVGANAPRWVKNVIGGGGGLGALAAAGSAAGAGAYFGMDPLAYSGATTLAGLGLARYGNMRALNRARELELMLLSRSPYAARTGIPDVAQPRGMTFLAPLMAQDRTLKDLGD